MRTVALLITACACSSGRSDEGPIERDPSPGPSTTPTSATPAHVVRALAAARDVADEARGRCAEVFRQADTSCFQGGGGLDYDQRPVKPVELGPNALADADVLYWKIECQRILPGGKTALTCMFRPSRPASEWKTYHPDASYRAAPGFELFNFDAIPPETGAGVLVGASPNAFPYRIHVTQPIGDGTFVHVDALVADRPR